VHETKGNALEKPPQILRDRVLEKGDMSRNRKNLGGAEVSKMATPGVAPKSAGEENGSVRNRIGI